MTCGAWATPLQRGRVLRRFGALDWDRLRVAENERCNWFVGTFGDHPPTTAIAAAVVVRFGRVKDIGKVQHTRTCAVRTLGSRGRHTDPLVFLLSCNEERCQFSA